MTEETTVIEILIRRRSTLVDEIRKIDLALDALGHRGRRQAETHVEVEAFPPQFDPEPLIPRRLARALASPPADQLALDPVAAKGTAAWAQKTGRGTPRVALPKGAIDEALIALLRAEQARPYVRIAEIARVLAPRFRRPGRSDRNWHSGIIGVARRLVAERRIRRVAGVKGGYCVVRRSPGVEAPVRANRKVRTSNAHAAPERVKSPSDRATS